MGLVLLKMSNGDEIIGKEIVDEKIDLDIRGMLVEQPRMLTLHQGQSGEYQVGMMPWLLSDPDGKCHIRLDHIAARISHIPAELEKGYISQTSKIALL